MRLWWQRARDIPGAPGSRGLDVSDEEWVQSARDVAASGGRLLSVWVSPGKEVSDVHAAYLTHLGLLITALTIGADSAYPGLEGLFLSASRMQRAAFDMTGVRSTDPDVRPWLRHAAWPAGHHPLSDPAPPLSARTPPGELSPLAAAQAYDFVRVEGEGVHEIAVGPVHAGIIEPGHFRFSVVGEKVLRLEAHLGYVHKGIERRFTDLPILEGHRLAARISGDSAVAFTWAYCQALEGMASTEIPLRAAWLRAAFLELERVANHLGDLGALGNDAGFAFGLSQFSRLKEQLLRAVASAFGQRYLMDAIVPGGTRVDLAPHTARNLSACLDRVVQEVGQLRAIYDEHAGLRDRFSGTGRLDPVLATRLGVLGLAARASAQALDLRVDLPCVPYADLSPRKIVLHEGDVAARVGVRFEELVESCRLLRRILGNAPPGPHVAALEVPPADAFGVGLIEGWRGPAFVALKGGAGGRISACHPQDPSAHAWPALEHAIIGNIVPDFPLINKSFNLSYSGPDL
jgi:Ni,Fe-hydrogenase III large subunit